VTVCAAEIAAGSRPELRRLPAYPLPVLRIARLAVGAEAQGRGIGSLLLDAAFQLASKMADDLGCVGVVVDAKADAVGWYERLGFRRMEVVGGELGDRPVPAAMFLPLGEMPRR
jgi:ribosomal protein S18 acetylase RimI-like enzyme